MLTNLYSAHLQHQNKVNSRLKNLTARLIEINYFEEMKHYFRGKNGKKVKMRPPFVIYAIAGSVREEGGAIMIDSKRM